MKRQTLPYLVGIFGLLIAISGCTSTSPSNGALIPIRVTVDGTIVDGQVHERITVRDALSELSIEFGLLDESDPRPHTLIEPNMSITITRIKEETIILDEVIPFETRTTINDAMPVNETKLLQAGMNGIAEVTYRIVFQDGVEINRSEIRRVIVLDSQDEITMTGSQTSLQTVTVAGTLFYINNGNLWTMSSNSLNRRPLTLEGSLDGRVISISPDGTSVLYTSAIEDHEDNLSDFNELFLIENIRDPDSAPVSTGLINILYAEWIPEESDSIAYSTAEPRAGFPGWQANNDLWFAKIRYDGRADDERKVLESSSGGIYGWFGTFFNFGPTRETLAWSRPDGAGMLIAYYDDDDPEEIKGYYTVTLASFAPKNPYDLVWVPEFSLSPDGLILALITHGEPVGNENPEDSEIYDLTIINSGGGTSIKLRNQVGMWSAPRYSSIAIKEDGSYSYRLAYLQAVTPHNSQTSNYQLIVMDRDGSEERLIFPLDEMNGLSPADQDFAWSPDGDQIALTIHGNLFLIDIITGHAQQLSQGGLTRHPIWIP